MDLLQVLAAQAGDLDAYDALMLTHQPAITLILHRFTTQRPDLEDMVQETFLRAWRALPQWRPDKPFLHWLKRIASNVGLEFCRKHQRSPFSRLVQPLEPHEDLLESLPAKTTEAAHTASSAALESAQLVLSYLPPEDRALLTLLHLNEMPLADIAAHFGWSRVKAKVKAFRARQRLKALLEKQGIPFSSL